MPRTRVRPGATLREVLEREGSATIGTIYQEYKSKAVEATDVQMRPRTRQRVMSYESFRKVIWQARQLGLVSVVDVGQPVDGLLMIAPGSSAGSGEVLPARANIYALTVEGRGERNAWENLRKAFDERGPTGITDQGRMPLPSVPVIQLPEGFTVRTVPRLLIHLEALARLAEAHDYPDTPFPALETELESIGEQVSAWVAGVGQFQRNAEEREDADRATELEELADSLGNVQQALEDDDIQEAISELESL